jgi:hypothetical protein
MTRYHETIKEEAKAVFKECGETFQNDAEEHGGKSGTPNLALWLDRTGALAKHVEKVSKTWGKKDLLWINENSRHNVKYGDPQDSAFGAYYKDILFELKKLMRKPG